MRRLKSRIVVFRNHCVFELADDINDFLSDNESIIVDEIKYMKDGDDYIAFVECGRTEIKEVKE